MTLWTYRRPFVVDGVAYRVDVATGLASVRSRLLCDGRVLLLELKSLKGKLSPAQEAFRDAILAQGFGWALVRSLDDALGALADHGFTSRVVMHDTAQRGADPRLRAAP